MLSLVHDSALLDYYSFKLCLRVIAVDTRHNKCLQSHINRLMPHSTVLEESLWLRGRGRGVVWMPTSYMHDRMPTYVNNFLFVLPEGKHLATKRNCKFIEVSALLNHKMDELLVGTLRQIRLRQTKTSGIMTTTATPSTSVASASRQQASSNQRNRYHHQRQPVSTSDTAPGDGAELVEFGCLQRAAMALFGKLFQRSVLRSASCDDLFKP